MDGTSFHDTPRSFHSGLGRALLGWLLSWWRVFHFGAKALVMAASPSACSGLATAATADGGQFVYQSRTGDGVMTALVPAANPVQSGARYAVMVRENATNSGAAMAATSTSSSTSEGTKMAYRATTSATAVFTGAVTADVAPRRFCSVRQRRTGAVRGVR